VTSSVFAAALLFLAALLVSVSTAASSSDARREVLAWLIGTLIGWGAVEFTEAGLAFPPSLGVLLLSLLVGVPWLLRPRLEAQSLRYGFTAIGAIFGAVITVSAATSSGALSHQLVTGFSVGGVTAIALAASGPAILPSLTRPAARRGVIGSLWGMAVLCGGLQRLFAL
jgi:hypothetical protein